MSVGQTQQTVQSIAEVAAILLPVHKDYTIQYVLLTVYVRIFTHVSAVSCCWVSIF